MDNIKNELEFYSKFARPLIFGLPDAKDRVLAAAWVKKIKEDEIANEKLKTDYIKLLLFALQRRKLVGIFTDNPTTYETLEEFPDEYDLNAMAQELIEKEQRDRRANIRNQLQGQIGDFPPYTTDISSDLREYVAAQDIPGFGVHCYYAISKDPITTWQKADKGVFPKSVKSVVNTSSPLPTGAHGGASDTCVVCPGPEGTEPCRPRGSLNQSETDKKRKKKSKKKLGDTPPVKPLVSETQPEEEDRRQPTWSSNLMDIIEIPRSSTGAIPKVRSEKQMHKAQQKRERLGDLSSDMEEDYNEMERALKDYQRGEILEQRKKRTKRNKREYDEEEEEEDDDEDSPEVEFDFDNFFDLNESEYEQELQEDSFVVKFIKDTINKRNIQKGKDNAKENIRGAIPAQSSIPLTTPKPSVSPRRLKSSPPVFAINEPLLRDSTKQTATGSPKPKCSYVCSGRDPEMDKIFQAASALTAQVDDDLESGFTDGDSDITGPDDEEKEEPPPEPKVPPPGERMQPITRGSPTAHKIFAEVVPTLLDQLQPEPVTESPYTVQMSDEDECMIETHPPPSDGERICSDRKQEQYFETPKMKQPSTKTKITEPFTKLPTSRFSTSRTGIPQRSFGRSTEIQPGGAGRGTGIPQLGGGRGKGILKPCSRGGPLVGSSSGTRIPQPGGGRGGPPIGAGRNTGIPQPTGGQIGSGRCTGISQSRGGPTVTDSRITGIPPPGTGLGIPPPYGQQSGPIFQRQHPQIGLYPTTALISSGPPSQPLYFPPPPMGIQNHLPEPDENLPLDLQPHETNQSFQDPNRPLMQSNIRVGATSGRIVSPKRNSSLKMSQRQPIQELQEEWIPKSPPTYPYQQGLVALPFPEDDTMLDFAKGYIPPTYQSPPVLSQEIPPQLVSPECRDAAYFRGYSADRRIETQKFLGDKSQNVNLYQMDTPPSSCPESGSRICPSTAGASAARRRLNFDEIDIGADTDTFLAGAMSRHPDLPPLPPDYAPYSSFNTPPRPGGIPGWNSPDIPLPQTPPLYQTPVPAQMLDRVETPNFYDPPDVPESPPFKASDCDCEGGNFFDVSIDDQDFPPSPPGTPFDQRIPLKWYTPPASSEISPGMQQMINRLPEAQSYRGTRGRRHRGIFNRQDVRQNADRESQRGLLQRRLERSNRLMDEDLAAIESDRPTRRPAHPPTMPPIPGSPPTEDKFGLPSLVLYSPLSRYDRYTQFYNRYPDLQMSPTDTAPSPVQLAPTGLGAPGIQGVQHAQRPSPQGYRPSRNLQDPRFNQSLEGVRARSGPQGLRVGPGAQSSRSRSGPQSITAGPGSQNLRAGSGPGLRAGPGPQGPRTSPGPQGPSEGPRPQGSRTNINIQGTRISCAGAGRGTRISSGIQGARMDPGSRASYGARDRVTRPVSSTKIPYPPSR